MELNNVKKKRAALHTLGCRLNQSETTLITSQLRAAGYEIVPFDSPAELGIINTCTVTNEADAKSRQLVRSFIRRNPDAYTAVIGCYSQMGYKTLCEIVGVDLIVGNQEKLNVLDYVAAGRNDIPMVIRDRMERDDFTIEIQDETGITRRSNLKIQDGCDFMCTFCIIPFARGRARSRALSNLLEEARRLVERGARELVLTGVNVGTYGYDNHDIVDVCSALNDIEDLARIRISSIEPTTIPEALLELMDAPTHKLVPYLHIPLQSGSDAVLARMKRKYTAAEFVAFIEKAAARVRDLCIGTDVLVGMPGETDTEFGETTAILRDSPIAYAHVFKYSERDGTPATRFPGKVDADTAKRRSAVVRRLSAQKRREFYRTYLNRELPVLFEQVQDGYWPGYTENYIRVAIASEQDLENQIRPVRLEEVCADFVLGNIHVTADC